MHIMFLTLMYRQKSNSLVTRHILMFQSRNNDFIKSSMKLVELQTSDAAR